MLLPVFYLSSRRDLLLPLQVQVLLLPLQVQFLLGKPSFRLGPLSPTEKAGL
jgi:hypothetical protein